MFEKSFEFYIIGTQVYVYSWLLYNQIKDILYLQNTIQVVTRA